MKTNYWRRIFEMKISRFIPRKIVAYIKAKDQLVFYETQMNKILEQPFRYAYLFGTPNHMNLGDHLIAAAELQYLQNEFGMEVMEIPTEMYHIYRNQLKRAIPTTALVFITGGGWMGDVWPLDERTLENMAFDFRNNKTVILPQTIYYKNDDNNNKVANKAKEVFNMCPRLKICVRDQASYDYAIRNYNNDIALCPDIALYYKQKLTERNNSPKRIGICFRDDREKLSHVGVEEIQNAFKNMDVTFSILSTISKQRVSCAARLTQVENLLKEFHSCDLVLTDRLHGMIYAYLADSPCIAFDNLTHKVAGVYDLWLNHSSDIRIMSNDVTVEAVYRVGKELLSGSLHSFKKEAISFQKLNEVIKK